MNSAFCLILLVLVANPVWAATPLVCHLDNCVGIEVVSKPEDMQRGLMYRNGLDKDQGMFFVFTYDDRHRFWMKNMNFDLDMVWISLEGRIVDISQNVPACKTDPCPVYSPNSPCRYVLELSRGYAALHNWKVKDQLTIPSSDLKNIDQHP
jgi:uncharacterized membrane protein (UPF0127 family)